LWSFRRGETEYGVKAIPAGGFVKIVGMTQLEEIDPADEPRAFYRQPAPQRAVVLGAGSFMHFVIATVLFVVALSAIGVSSTTTRIAKISGCVPHGAQSACAPGDPAAPAQLAGLRAGDTITALDGHRTPGYADVQDYLRAHGGQEVAITVQRGAQQLTVHARLATTSLPDIKHPDRLDKVGFLGVTPALSRDHMNPAAALGSGFGSSVAGTFQALGKLPSEIPQLLAGRPRTADNSATSVVGVGQIAGDVVASGGGAADVAGALLLITATLNVFVGIFNLLPLLPLDGGHLAILAFEQGRSRVYRLVGRRDPGRVDLTKLLPAAYLVIALFVGLSALLVLSDILNPVANPFGG
jgi:membrane-associated protease RseP (regulator of RpoE activity)